MNKTRSTMCALVVCLFICMCVSVAQAVPRTFVSGSGNDANTATGCPFSNPCRFLSAAYSVTDLGGEIIALTTAGYGGLTINTPVTIRAIPGQVGFVSVITGASGIVVNAGASDTVVIRNFQFSGSPAGAANSIGITHNTGRLLLDGCTITQLTTGVLVNNAASRVNIRGSILQANGTGLYVTAGRVAVTDCQISNNTTGVRADGDGGANNSPPNGTTLVRIDQGNITHNTTGLHMHNPGMKPFSGIGNGANIFIRLEATAPTTNIIDNTTGLLVTGNASQCGADPCATPNPGKYTTELNVV